MRPIDPPLRPPSVAAAVVAVAAVAMLAGCASRQRTDSLFGVITPYRIDIVQGNAVTREQAAQVRPGMTRLQVRDVLGTPLVTDPFHADRWDYIFTLRRPKAEPQRRHVVVWFEGDAVQRIDAPELPSERDFVASIARPGKPKDVKLELTDDERRALPPPKPRDAAADEPAGAVRSYPPLEGG